MANDTPKKPGDKVTPAVKAPDNKNVDAGGKGPASKQPEKPIAPIAKTDEQKKPEAPKKIVPFDKNKSAQVDGTPAPEKPATQSNKPAPKKAQEAPGTAALSKKEAAQKELLIEMDKRTAAYDKSQRRKPTVAKKPPVKNATQNKASALAAKAQAGKAKEQQPAPPLENPFLKPSEKTGAKNKETIIEVDLAQLHPFHTFRKHPYKVKENAKMTELVESVKVNGVMQPGLARPEKDGNGFELIAGHRRRLASQLAHQSQMPVIVREMTDLEAVRAMKDSNKQRDEDLPSERAALLDLELEALKHQGAQDVKNIPPEHVGKRSNEIVAETNGLTVKQVQRYIRLTKLTPELLDMVDDKKIGFTPAVEISFIQPKNQKYIAVAIEGQQSAPSLSQAQRMRELDQKGLLIPDVIDGILLEEKKEVEKVILSTQELGQYFGKETTPREMKDTILKLLDEYKDKQKDIPLPEKKTEHEK